MAGTASNCIFFVSVVAVYTLHQKHCFTAAVSSRYASGLQFIAKTKEAVSATCCYTQRQLTWEVTESGQRNKVELKWDDITSLRVTPMVSICSLQKNRLLFVTPAALLFVTPAATVCLAKVSCSVYAKGKIRQTPYTDVGADQGCCCYRDQQLSYWK